MLNNDLNHAISEIHVTLLCLHGTLQTRARGSRGEIQTWIMFSQ